MERCRLEWTKPSKAVPAQCSENSSVRLGWDKVVLPVSAEGSSSKRQDGMGLQDPNFLDIL